MTKRKAITNPRCVAHKKTGEQCKNLAGHGMTVCRYHGGAAPQTQAKARERILAAADPAAATVLEIMFDRNAPAPVRLAAAKDILDRAGLSPRSIVEVEATVDPTLLAMVVAARDNALADRAPVALPGSQMAVAEVIDAELAEDADDRIIDLDFGDDA